MTPTTIRVWPQTYERLLFALHKREQSEARRISFDSLLREMLDLWEHHNK